MEQQRKEKQIESSLELAELIKRQYDEAGSQLYELIERRKILAAQLNVYNTIVQLDGEQARKVAQDAAERNAEATKPPKAPDNLNRNKRRAISAADKKKAAAETKRLADNAKKPETGSE